MRVFAGSSPEPSTTCTPAMGRPAVMRWSVTTRAPASRAALPRDHLADLLQQQLGGAVVALPGGLADHLPQGCRVDGGQRGRLRRGRPGAGAAADHHPPLGQQVHEQLGRRGRGVGGGVGPVVVVRVDDVAVVDGEGRQRPGLAVAAVAGRPRRHVAHRVVAAVVAHAASPGPRAGRWRPRCRRTPPTRCAARAGAGSGPPSPRWPAGGRRRRPSRGRRRAPRR